jgi:hypothetical protein
LIKSETPIFYKKGERLGPYRRIYQMGSESLAEIENCSVVPVRQLCQDLWQLPPDCVQVQQG